MCYGLKTPSMCTWVAQDTSLSNRKKSTTVQFFNPNPLLDHDLDENFQLHMMIEHYTMIEHCGTLVNWK